MLFLYSISVRLYVIAIHIAALFSAKASDWVRGRKNLWAELKDAVPAGKKLVWFHASSLGEFEQGRPVMEHWRRTHPEDFILLSFFSPSGYNVRKNFAGADFVCYLPADTARNARRFISITGPYLVFFVKYDFWLNHIRAVTDSGTKLIFFSCRFRKEQYFFQSWGKAALGILKRVSWFFVQDENSATLLTQAGILQCGVAGDTRFDRVAEAAAVKKDIPLAENFAGGEKILVAGSSWPQDEELLLRLLLEDRFGYRMIIAPHEVHRGHIDPLMKRLGKNAILFSEADGLVAADKRILVVDSIGMLLHIYRLAHVAYIGGGFGKSIHNLLEAAAFGKPVVFGPAFHKFEEAHDLIRLGGGFAVNNYTEFRDTITSLFNDEEKYNTASVVCTQYTQKNTGATNIILQKAGILTAEYQKL
jgi:3-deoxy-D-manno-octulosonic-acid transferase